MLRARDLGKVYRTGEVEVHALRGVDLELWPGELVVLLGPSGSGKSTLLNILGGLDSASTGEAWFEDQDLTAGDRELTRYRREHVGFVFQFYNLIASLTALENVALVTEIATRPMEPAAALRLVGSASGCTISRRNCPVASNSASPSRAPSPSNPTSCSATNRPARSTARRACSCSKPSRAFTANSAPPRCSSRTTRSSPTWPIACWCSATGASSRNDATRNAARRASCHGDAMKLHPLDRKLLRDLWRLRGQVLAIGLVIASGVGLLVMSLTSLEALRTRRPLITNVTGSPTCSRR